MRFISAMIFVWAVMFEAAAQPFTAEVDTDRVPQGEVFNLNLSYEGDDGASVQPDLSGLSKDFTIYSTSSSTQMSFINGQSSQQRDWNIGLMAKRDGVLTIPAISAGKYQSKPLTITVLPAGSSVGAVRQENKVKNDNQLANTAKFEAELVVEDKTPYLQQEVNAVLTIRDRAGLRLAAEPQFTDTEHWLVKSLRRPEIKQENGERVIKFYYALFPQKSGRQDVPAVKISGSYVNMDNSNRHPLLQQGFDNFFQFMSVDINDIFGVEKPVELYTKPVEIEVKPAVADNGGNWWLPAEALNLEAVWSDKKPLFKVGETVAREIAVTAVGVADTQLPELVLKDNDNVKQYPENPQLSSEVYENKIVSQAVIRVVYIPQKGGEMILPEIKLPWFNTKSGKLETAVVPAEKIFVEGGVAADDKPAAAAVPVKTTENTVQQPDKTNEVNTADGKRISEKMSIFLAAAAFVLGLVVSSLLRRDKKSAKAEHKSNSEWCGVLRKNLENKDYRLLRDNLLKWGNETFSDKNISNLNDLSELVPDEGFRQQLQLLNKILYNGETADLDSAVFLRVLKGGCTLSAGRTEQKEPLPKLYK